MSAPASSPVAPGRSGRSPWGRRHRAITVLVLVGLLTVLALSVVTTRSAGRTGDLDPANPAPNGAQAVARVLAEHGVRLEVVRRAADLRRATVDADTTVLITSTGHLGRTTARQVRTRTASAGLLVLAAPGPTLIRALRLPLSLTAAQVDRSTPARCGDPLLRALTLDVGPSTAYRGRDSSVTPCFGVSGPTPGALVVRVDRSPRTYAVGGTDLFSNHRAAGADNADAALRLLGQRGRLLWYVPDPRDVVVGDRGSFAAQLPRGLVPSVWLLAAAVLATMLWRGRRLGPLVREPLPVAVKAVESTQGRGRLYRRARDRGHAAAVLREATARRLAARLRMPSGTDARLLADAVARTTGADSRHLHDLLVDRRINDDDGLARLAGDLAALEREVHDA